MKRPWPREKDIDRFFYGAMFGDNRRIDAFLDVFGCEQIDIVQKSALGDEKTALMMAAKYMNESGVKLLLRRGADINLTDEKGLSAFGIALLYGADRDENDYVPDILFAAGADWQREISVIEKMMKQDLEDTSGKTREGLKKEYEGIIAEIRTLATQKTSRLELSGHNRDDEMTAAVEAGTQSGLVPARRICVRKRAMP